MTPDELKAAVERDEHDKPAREFLRPYKHKVCAGRLEVDIGCLIADRGALLDLLRRIYQHIRPANALALPCPLCCAEPDAPCEPDCPAPVLEVLR